MASWYQETISFPYRCSVILSTRFSSCGLRRLLQLLLKPLQARRKGMQNNTTPLEGYHQTGSVECTLSVSISLFLEVQLVIWYFILLTETLLSLHISSIIFLDLSYHHVKLMTVCFSSTFFSYLQSMLRPPPAQC